MSTYLRERETIALLERVIFVQTSSFAVMILETIVLLVWAISAQTSSFAMMKFSVSVFLLKWVGNDDLILTLIFSNHFRA